MREMRLCSISDEYIEFLREDFPNVYSNKETRRTHTRKYIGVVMQISEYLYYIPMSSPKDTDYQVAGDKKVIKKSIVPIMRMVIKNSKGEKELKGTLRFSHMIPVPETEVEWYDIEKEKDEKYKDLVQSEIIYIRKNQEKIRKSAELIYKQKTGNIENIKYLNSVLDYRKLEEKCKEFKNKEVCDMALSMAVVPLLNEEATQSLMETLKKSKLKPYTDEQRKATDEAIEKIFAERFKNS